MPLGTYVDPLILTGPEYNSSRTANNLTVPCEFWKEIEKKKKDLTLIHIYRRSINYKIRTGFHGEITITGQSKKGGRVSWHDCLHQFCAVFCFCNDLLLSIL